jgi:predicted ATPase
MTINKLSIANFKGISDAQKFDVKPITIFVGPNSSGKSTCMHALSALAQTVKISRDERPIVLDDEFAQVNLGRFIDIVHSRSFNDSVTLGLGIDEYDGYLPKIARDSNKKLEGAPSCLDVEYIFSCDEKTEEINLRLAKYGLRVNGQTYEFQIEPKEPAQAEQREYRVLLNGTVIAISAVRREAFFFYFLPEHKNGKEDTSDPSKDDFQWMLTLDTMQFAIRDALNKCLYLGPFRQGPRRRYQTRGASPVEVGAAGEAAVTMLANEMVRFSNRPAADLVSKWISQLGLGTALSMRRFANTDLVDVSLNLSDGAELPLTDLGFGVSQVLPVLVQCAFAKEGSTLLFEQPELHLHQGAARKLGAIFCDVAKSRKLNLLLETHSPELCRAVMNEIREGRLTCDDVAFYAVTREDGSSCFKRVVMAFDGQHLEVDHPWLNSLDA